MKDREHNTPKDLAQKKPFRFLEALRRLVESDYFRVDTKRAREYLSQDRSQTRFKANRQIPIGKRSSMEYSGQVVGGVSDRPIGEYQSSLFPDVFTDAIPVTSGYSLERFLSEAQPLEQPPAEFGGYEEVFKPGNVVLDIASGEAVAAMQFALKFPETTIIGTDILYKDERRVYPQKVGLQLTHADWRFLRAIPNQSVDAILSMQGIAMWGLPRDSGEDSPSHEDGLKIIQALNRISKPGTIIRLDQYNDFLGQHIGDNWEISSRRDAFIAKRVS